MFTKPDHFGNSNIRCFIVHARDMQGVPGAIEQGLNVNDFPFHACAFFDRFFLPVPVMSGGSPVILV